MLFQLLLLRSLQQIVITQIMKLHLLPSLVQKLRLSKCLTYYRACDLADLLVNSPQHLPQNDIQLGFVHGLGPDADPIFASSHLLSQKPSSDAFRLWAKYLASNGPVAPSVQMPPRLIDLFSMFLLIGGPIPLTRLSTSSRAQHIAFKPLLMILI